MDDCARDHSLGIDLGDAGFEVDGRRVVLQLGVVLVDGERRALVSKVILQVVLCFAVQSETEGAI